MRYVDLAFAALIGTSAIAGMVAFSPHQGDAASGILGLRSQLRDELVTVLQTKGVDWLVQSSPAEICDYLEGLSNSSVTFSAAIGSYACGPTPPSGVPAADLDLSLIPHRVILEAWANSAG